MPPSSPPRRRRALLRGLAAAVVLLASGLAATPAHASSPDEDRIDDATFVVTVAKDGGVHVEATLDVRYAEPEDLPSLWWNVPTRVPVEDDDDVDSDELVSAQTLSHVTSTVRLGDDAATTRSVPVDTDALGGGEYLDVAWPDFLDAPVDSARFTLSYDVAGAVLARGGSPAALALALVDRSATLPLDAASVRVVGPRGPVSGLTCATASEYYDDTTCTPDSGGVRATIGGDHGLVVGAPEVPGATGQEPTLASRSDDTIDHFTADYTVDPDGSLDVTETIVYRFGVDSDQHGIIRSLVSREPWSTWKDRTYGIDVVGVTSPSGADATLQRSTNGSERLRTTDLRVGSKDDRVRTPTATYVLHYRVDGALLRRNGHDQLSWDVTGNLSSTLYEAVDVTVHLPAAATSARCWSGAPGSTDPCAKADASGDVATFQAEKLDGGEGVTIDVTMQAGSVSATGPDLAPRALPVALLWYLRLLVGLGALSLVVSVVVAMLWRLTHRDARDRGVAAPDGPRGTPPDLPLPVAGTIVDGVMSSRETTGVLLALAAAGVIAFEQDGDAFALRVVKPAGGRDPFERAVVGSLEKHVAQIVADDAPDEDDRPTLIGDMLRAALHDAHAALRKAVRADLDVRQKTPGTALFRHTVRMRAGDPVRWPWTLLALPVPGLFPAVVVVRLVHGLRPTGRSAVGARYVEETRAFRRFLADLGASRAPGRAAPVAPVAYVDGSVGGVPGMLSTGGTRAQKASTGSGTAGLAATGLTPTGGPDPLATQDDLFGTLLPWAVALGVADDWSERLAPLVRDGLVDVPEGLPWNARSRDPWSGLWLMRSTAAAVAWTPASGSGGSSSGTGYSGGSSYSGGGGFSGGGGGGGGTSSW